MNWASTRVLVTGAGGFIGSHLVEALVSRGANVRAMVRYESRGRRGHLDAVPVSVQRAIEVVAGDVRDPFFVDRSVAGVDVVLHLASLIAIPYSYEAPQSYVETIVSGALHVLEAARRHATRRIVHISTSEVYGTAQYTPIDEAHPLRAQSPYSACKIGADKLAESFHLSFGVPVTILRPFNTYGPRQSARAVIPTIISQALTRDRIELGALEPTRDFLFVGDTVEAMIRAAEVDAAVGETVHVGSGVGITIGDLAAKILGRMGLERPVLSAAERGRPSSSEVGRLLCDPSKARSLLGWRPQISLDEGLDRAIDYVRARAADFRAEEYAR